MSSSLIRRPHLLIGSAALLLSAAAHAEFQVYGTLDLSLGKNEIKETPDKNFDFRSGSNSTSKLGFKGSADVGHGLKANFQLESGAIDAEGSIDGAFFGRQAWAGLSGAFGEARLGLQDSVGYAVHLGNDLNGAANSASALVNAGVSPTLGNGRAKGRELQYFSPSFGGVKFLASVQPAGAKTYTTNGVTEDAKTNGGLAAAYTAGPLNVALSFESRKTENSANAAGLSATYALGAAKVMASYSKIGDSFGPGLGVSAPVAGFTVGAQFAKNNANGALATEWFVNREVLKNTVVYFDVGTLNTTTEKVKQTYALGAIYSF
ncbi:MAG: hypothetical protein RL223_3891 [Pseudomonadota bacterium]